MELDDLDFEKLQKIEERMSKLGKPQSLNPSEGFRSHRGQTTDLKQALPAPQEPHSATKEDYLELDFNKPRPSVAPSYIESSAGRTT